MYYQPLIHVNYVHSVLNLNPESLRAIRREVFWSTEQKLVAGFISLRACSQFAILCQMSTAARYHVRARYK